MQEKQRGKMIIITAQNPSTKSEQTIPPPCSLSSPHRASWSLSHMDVAQNSCAVLMPGLGAGGQRIASPSRCSLEKCKRIRSVVIVSPKQEVLTSTATHLWAGRHLSLLFLVLACSSLTRLTHPQSCYIKIRNLVYIDLLTLGRLLLWVGLNYYWLFRHSWVSHAGFYCTGAFVFFLHGTHSP